MFPFFSLAQDKSKSQEVAKVIYVQGKSTFLKVENAKKSSWRETKVGVELAEGDKVRTQKKSFVRIKQGDNLLSLGPNGQITIESLKKDSSIINLVRGFIWSKVSSGKKDHYAVKTKTAAMGVRGTQFGVHHSSKGDLTCMCEGQVKVLAGKIAANLKKGDGLELIKGKKHYIKYLEMMDKGRPLDSFKKLAKKDTRYNQCLYCHNQNFHLKKFRFPEYSDLADFDYD